MKKTLILSLSVLPFAMMACGDDVTEVTQVNENAYVAELKSGEKLSKQPCDNNNVGDVLFVVDSATSFFCNGKTWMPLKGKDGINGESSVGEVGSDGASCSAKKVTKNKRVGFELTCGKTVIDTLWNGIDGANGKDAKGEGGDNGASCSAKKVTKGERVGYELVCDKIVVDTLWNGVDGAKGERAVGCEILSDEAGVVTIACGSGDKADTTTVYRATCGLTPFNPETHFCSEGKIVAYGWLEYEGQKYKTVKIGSQTWMAENLNYAYNKPTAELDSSSFCPDNDPEKCKKYGRYYLWSAAIDSTSMFEKDGTKCGFSAVCNPEGVQGICPEDWHLPSRKDFEEMIKFVDPSYKDATNYFSETSSETAGKAYKIGFWGNSNWVGGTDNYGFSAIPTGLISSYSKKYYGGSGYAAYWTSTYAYNTNDDKDYGNFSFYVELYGSSDEMEISYNTRSYYMPVRCVKNE